jgi:integrase
VARPRKASVKLPPHVHAVKARGKDYYYFQRFRSTERQEPRIKLPGAPLDRDGIPVAEWWRAYRKLSGEVEPKAKRGTFSAVILAYKESPEWRELSARTRSERGRHLAKIEAAWGELLVTGLEARHVLQLRDRHAATPGEANNIVRSLSSLMSWSIPRGWRTYNPCTKIRMLRIGQGYAPWTWEEIEEFRTHARADLRWAAAVALYSGQRQGDVLGMLWSDIQEGLISVTQNKTGKKLWIPMHEHLRAVLAEIPRVSVHVLTNSRGVPWTTDGFKSSWGDEMKREAFKELHERELVFHGLRKSAVVFLLEAGCTDAEVSAITGQSRGMVVHYAREVNQKKLAAAAVLKWQAAGEAGRTKNENEPGL